MERRDPGYEEICHIGGLGEFDTQEAFLYPAKVGGCVATSRCRSTILSLGDPFQGELGPKI